MTYTLARWEQDQLDRHLESIEYDYDQYTNLPFKWDVKLRRYRDVERGAFVDYDTAIRGNDAECEKQEEEKCRLERLYDMEEA